MKTITPLILIPFFLVFTLTSCSDSQQGAVNLEDYPHPAGTSELRATIKKSDRVFIYEGLPHQGFESELFKREKQRKDIIIIGGYPFYTPKNHESMIGEAALKDIIAKTNNYTQCEGIKLCGGFHPDYAIEWANGDKNYYILFCYSCGEVLVVDDNKTYIYDFKFTEELKAIFNEFESKRP